MPVIFGNVSTSATGGRYDIPSKIKFISIVNKSGATATVNLSILQGSTNINIIPKDQSLDASGANSQYVSDNEIDLPVDAVIYLLTNKSVDYYIAIE